MHEFHAHIEETKIKLWGVALLGCALNCKTRGAVWCEFLLGRGLWGKGAKGQRTAPSWPVLSWLSCCGQFSFILRIRRCYFVLIVAMVLSVWQPCPAVSCYFSLVWFLRCHCQLICNFWHNDFKLSNRKWADILYSVSHLLFVRFALKCSHSVVRSLTAL